MQCASVLQLMKLKKYIQIFAENIWLYIILHWSYNNSFKYSWTQHCHILKPHSLKKNSEQND